MSTKKDFGLGGEYFTAQQAAEYCGLTKHTLFWRTKKGYFTVEKIGRSFLYKKNELDAYLASKTELNPVLTEREFKQLFGEEKEMAKNIIYAVFVQRTTIKDVAKNLGVTRSYIHKVCANAREKIHD